MNADRRGRRFFTESLAGDVVELPEAEAHHAVNVLRLTNGAEVELFDGRGSSAVGLLGVLGRRQASVRIRRRRQEASRPEPLVELAFAVPKGKRLDWLLEKATELGAWRLDPLILERSVVIPSADERLAERWRRHCIAAAKQCRACFLPEIGPARTLDGFLSTVESPIRILGDTDARTSVPAALDEWSPGKSITVLVGPEGGLTESEIAAASRAGFAGVRLGNFTLRVETAAVALLAAVNACCLE